MADLKTTERTDAQWREALTPEQYRVLRRHGTESPFSGAYVHEKADGTYRCAGCGSELFSSATKFDSRTGWPSFTEPAVADAVVVKRDFKMLFPRMEVRCRRCDGHLGHVFSDGPKPTGKRFCINSCALDLDRAR
ncbi:MAG: peptide-methionine (R)-S-oxide reductase MsrB [Solirubrobacterales bacterium]|nr:peptide-methionine (R)-S-oxide reductase MsrB [Solirubrobacterales bacterium]